MRLFTAIDVPAEVLANLERLIQHLRPTARLAWSPVANLHITTKFIGEWPAERLGELEPALRSLPAFPPLAIQIARLGFFPNPHSPRVFWAGVVAPPELAALAAATDAAVARLGIPAENRPYSPHLTLARIKERIPMQPLREAIAALPTLEFGSFEADRFHLYQSRRQSSGSVYTKLSEFPFSK